MFDGNIGSHNAPDSLTEINIIHAFYSISDILQMEYVIYAASWLWVESEIVFTAPLSPTYWRDRFSRFYVQRSCHLLLSSFFWLVAFIILDLPLTLQCVESHATHVLLLHASVKDAMPSANVAAESARPIRRRERASSKHFG